MVLLPTKKKPLKKTFFSSFFANICYDSSPHIPQNIHGINKNYCFAPGAFIMKIAGEKIVPLVLEATGNRYVTSFTIKSDALILKDPDIITVNTFDASHKCSFSC
jgi:hypothetical protein